MKLKIIFITALFLFCITGFAQATLTTIGTANYGTGTYNLIYDDDDTGYGGGGLVWLDYTNPKTHWQNQVDWALGVGTSLTVNLSPDYTTSIDWTSGWRLPDAVNGNLGYGYEGDPNNDGIYTYSWGYNMTNSELTHLFYEELGNIGRTNTDGTNNDYPPDPDYFLQNKGEFENLVSDYYWYGTKQDSQTSWGFFMSTGEQRDWTYDTYMQYGMAVHSGTVSFDNGSQPIPEPHTLFLLGTGLLGLAKVGKKKFKHQ